MPKIRPLPPFIQKRRKRYYAVLEIPRLLRRHYPGKQRGKHLARLVRSLETDSLEVARRRAASLVAAWRSEFARLRHEGDDAAFFRRRLQKAKTDAERQQVLAEVEFAVENIGSTYLDHPSPADIAAIDRNTDERRADFYSRADGKIVGLTDRLDAYLERQNTTAKTKDMAKSDILDFANSFPTIQDVTYEGVQRWVDALGVAPATVVRTLSSLRGYWKFLQRHDIKAVPREFQPFTGLDLPESRNGPGNKRLSFEPLDILRLIINAKDDASLKDLIVLVMWTGCRIEEICSLQTKHVHLDAAIPYFEIKDAKTAAGWRQVPIHKSLFPQMKGLVAASKKEKDGKRYVLSGLSVNKYGDRSPAIGHRFGRLKAKLGYAKQYVFHSIRKTVVTLLENAGVFENVVADIVGHEKPRITYGLYSGGASLNVKAEALSKLSYDIRPR